MDLEITLQVNGATHRLSVDTRTTLLDALRERLGLTPRGVQRDKLRQNWKKGSLLYNFVGKRQR